MFTDHVEKFSCSVLRGKMNYRPKKNEVTKYTFAAMRTALKTVV